MPRRIRLAAALSDQAVVSGGNVLMAVTVARLLGAQSLGLYTLLVSIMLFTNAVVDATLSSSFMLRRPELEPRLLPAYSSANLLIALIGIILLSTLADPFVDYMSTTGMYGLDRGSLFAPALCAYLLREHFRRYAFASFRVTLALGVDVFAYALQGVFVLLLYKTSALAVGSLFTCIAVAHGIAAVMALVLCRRQFRVSTLPLRQVVTDTLHLSPWVVASHLLLIVGFQMMPWLVSHRLGYAAAGAYAAAMTLSNLANPLLTGFVNTMMPTGSAAYKDGPAEVRRALLGDTILLTALTTLLCAVTIVFARDLVALLFGDRYVDETLLVQILTASFLVRSLDVAPYVGCWAMRRPDQNVVGNVFLIVFGGGLSMLLMPASGAVGAGVSLLISNTVTVALRWSNFLRLTRQEQQTAVSLREAGPVG